MCHGSLDTSEEAFGFHHIRYQRARPGLPVKGMGGRAHGMLTSELATARTFTELRKRGKTGPAEKMLTC